MIQYLVMVGITTAFQLGFIFVAAALASIGWHLGKKVVGS